MNYVYVYALIYVYAYTPDTLSGGYIGFMFVMLHPVTSSHIPSYSNQGCTVLSRRRLGVFITTVIALVCVYIMLCLALLIFTCVENHWDLQY